MENNKFKIKNSKDHINHLNLKSEDYLNHLNLKLGNEFTAKSCSILIHNECGSKIWVDRKYLAKLVHKNQLPSCPYCKEKKSLNNK